MYKVSQTRLRQDLIVTFTTNKETESKTHLIKDPISGETFEFGEEEYFLCQSINGISTTSQIIAAFKSRFDLSITENDFNQFAEQITSYGLLEPCDTPVFSSSSSLVSFQETEDFGQPDISKESVEKNQEEKVKQKPRPQKVENLKEFRWKLFNPDTFYTFVAKLLRPFGWFFKALIWLLIPGVPLALLIYFKEQYAIWQDIKTFSVPEAYFVKILVNMMSINIISRLIQGIVCTALGGTVKEFALQLRFGILPRFQNDRRGYRQLSRRGQLWTIASPLLARLFFFVIGTFIWYCTHGTGTSLPLMGLFFAQAGLFGFLILILPIWGEGYRFFVLLFKLPPQLLQRALQTFMFTIQGRSLPTTISSGQRWSLLLYALVIISFWFYLMTKVVFSTAKGLVLSYPDIFGRSTRFIFIGAIASMALYWTSRKWSKMTQKGKNPNPSPVVDREVNVPEKAHLHIAKKTRSKTNHLVKILLLVGLGIVLFLPYPYKPGGPIQLMPPAQAKIQAPISGKITKVFFEGGNGKLIKSGTVIATMESTDLNNSILTLQQQVNEQQAVLEKQQDKVNQLLNTPSKQEVEVAKKELEVAKQEVEVSKRQLEVAMTKAQFSARQAARFEGLYKQGAYSLQLLEEAQKQAETDRINTDAMRDIIARKQKDVEKSEADLQVVLSGAPPDEIEAARRDVKAARANLNRVQQQLKYANEQLKTTKLLMPIDGHLTTSYLGQKLGTYLKEGDTFALAENDRNFIGQISIPEDNIGEFAVGNQVEIKLLAYPDKPIWGKIVSIEPIATDEPSQPATQVVKVNVEIANSDSQRVLKTGMSGYAKVNGGTKPVIVAFTRPITRFIQVEVWSWLP